MTKLIPVLLLTTSLAACASSGAMPVGPDTYVITSRAPPVAGGSMTAETNAISEANAYCQGLGRQMVMMSDQNGGVQSRISFRCLAPGDPELKRPNLKPAPNIVIENRQEKN
jgi:hypothetical protein